MRMLLKSITSPSWWAERLRGFDCPLELGHLDLAHLEHRFHRSPSLLLVRILDHLVELARDDLPRQAESVLEPAARAGLPTVRGKRFPQSIDLRLILTFDDERDGL